MTKSSRGRIVRAAVLGIAIFAIAPAALADETKSTKEPAGTKTAQAGSASQPTPYDPSMGQPGQSGSGQGSQSGQSGTGGVNGTGNTSSDVQPYDPYVPSSMPSSTATTTQSSTTQTTGAEYTENAEAERTTTFRPNRPLLATGATMLLAPYVAGVIVAAQSDLDADKRLYIPVVGPWLDLGQRPCAFGADCSTGDNIGSALLIGSGVAQGVGVILTAASFATPERRTATATVAAQKPRVSFSPVTYAGGGGVGAAGTF